VNLAMWRGKILHYEFRSAEGRLDRLSELAVELVRLKVDVIVALYVPCALAAKQVTREIPHRDNRSRPGGNRNSRQLGAARR